MLFNVVGCFVGRTVVGFLVGRTVGFLVGLRVGLDVIIKSLDFSLGVGEEVGDLKPAQLITC